MKIQVGVMGSNAGGEPDVIRFEIECTQEQYEQGDHYKKAERLASDQGFEPAMSFDERDPAWQALAPRSDEMEVFYRNLMDILKRTYSPGVEVDGADFVADVSQFCSDQAICLPDDFLVGVVWCDDAFCNEFGVAVEDFTVIFDRQVIEQLAQEGGVVAMVRPSLLFEANLPGAQDIFDAAESALARGKKYQFNVSADNAAEVMFQELACSGFENLPVELAPVLVTAMSSFADRDLAQKASLERDSA